MSGSRGEREIAILRRLERLPLTWVQGRLIAMGGLGYTFDGMDAALIAFILAPVMKLLTGLARKTITCAISSGVA